MELPDLVRQALGDEDVRAGVSLGDEDAICLTPTRTIVYHGESLLSDESVEEYSHNVERLSVSEGRRKTKFVLEYVDGTESFKVPANRGDKVLEVLLEGVLRVDGAIDEQESLAGVYRFTDLTLVITDRQVLKHIGQAVWDEDFEFYPYDDVTGLDFEEASVATSISLVVDGRPERIKVPSDEGGIVRRNLKSALFEYYDVASLDELNRVIDESDEDAPDRGDQSEDDDLDFGSGIDPLVTSDPDDDQPAPGEGRQPHGAGAGGPSQQGQAPQRGQPAQSQGREGSRDARARGAGGSAGGQPRDSASSQPRDAASGQTGQAGANEQARDAGGQRRDARSENQPRDAPAQGQSRDAPSQGQSRDAPSQGQSRDRRPQGQEPAETDQPAGGRSQRSERGDAGRESAGEARSAEASAEQSTPETSDAQRSEGGGDAQSATDETPTRDERDDSGGDGEAEAADEQSDESAADEWFGDSDDGGATDDAAADLAQALGYEPASRKEVEAVAEQLSDLTDAVERQNELLNRQHTTITQLVEELRDE